MKTICKFVFRNANKMSTNNLKAVCQKELIELLPNITASDKEEACKKTNTSRPTLDRYLKGEIKNLDRAIKIINFFKGKVKARVSQLKGAA